MALVTSVCGNNLYVPAVKQNKQKKLGKKKSSEIWTQQKKSARNL